GKHVEILYSKTKEQLCFLDKVEPHSSVGDIKSLFHKSYPKWYPARQALRLDPKEKALRDDDVLQNLPVGTSATLYFRDLGPQLGWTMGRVFLAEYMGPLLINLLFYVRVPYIYNHKYTISSSHHVVNLACACHSFHYIKRLCETIFVHQFSTGTMPLRAIIRNCAYYWGFAAWLAYCINHLLYTPPSNFLLLFKGAKCQRFPHPSKNPFTWLFYFVSCPNYTYEVGAWVGLSIMTQLALFTLVGFIQMTIWAKGKHKNYTREFKDYPNLRISILLFIL
uniref:Very-long-chain enoyl-CoA reductase n=1 Tax=Sinocyclocheilus rhinocerous TaxID=307959 RepID=A0A673I9P6_9TELE